MSKYVSIKGWLECEHSQLEEIHKIISDYGFKKEFESIVGYESMALYNKGWCNRKEIINWTSYIFYGADVKDYCAYFIQSEIREILSKCSEIEGMFFFQHEEGEMKCWKITNSQIREIDLPDGDGT